MKISITSLFVAGLVLISTSGVGAANKNGNPGNGGNGSGKSNAVQTGNNTGVAKTTFKSNGTQTVSKSSSGQMGSSNGSQHSPAKFSNSQTSKNYHTQHGAKFSHGYFYSGKSHSHWSHYCYWERFGCYCYWCPCTSCYYYWCEPAACYYPVTYATTVAPSANVPLIAINNVNGNGSSINTASVGGGAPTQQPAIGSELPRP